MQIFLRGACPDSGTVKSWFLQLANILWIIRPSIVSPYFEFFKQYTDTHKSWKGFVLFRFLVLTDEDLIVEYESVRNSLLHFFFGAAKRGIWDRPPLVSVCTNQNPNVTSSKQVWLVSLRMELEL